MLLVSLEALFLPPNSVANDREMPETHVPLRRKLCNSWRYVSR